MTLEWVNIDGYSTLSSDIDAMFNSIDYNIDKLKDIYRDAYEGEPFEEYEIRNATKLIDDIIKELNDVINIINKTINEYYIILNDQMELMDIDEYHDLRLLIKEAEKDTKLEIEKYDILPNIELAINIKKNILKQRNPSDIYKMICKLEGSKYYGFYLVEPEVFILPPDYII